VKINKSPSRRLIYVSVSPERIFLRRVATGETIDDVPQIAIDAQGAVAAFGHGAEEASKWRPDVRLLNGFSHPRSLIGDMEAAAVTLRCFLEKLTPGMNRRFRRARPDLVIHAAELRDLSGLEAWGLQRVAELAGARHVRLWLGEEPAYETLVLGAPQASGSFLSASAPKKLPQR
jgi:rod shape-determining protein MreB and related proteins